jgi:hypothetical protein
MPAAAVDLIIMTDFYILKRGLCLLQFLVKVRIKKQICFSKKMKHEVLSFNQPHHPLMQQKYLREQHRNSILHAQSGFG